MSNSQDNKPKSGLSLLDQFKDLAKKDKSVQVTKIDLSTFGKPAIAQAEPVVEVPVPKVEVSTSQARVSSPTAQTSKSDLKSKISPEVQAKLDAITARVRGQSSQAATSPVAKFLSQVSLTTPKITARTIAETGILSKLKLPDSPAILTEILPAPLAQAITDEHVRVEKHELTLDLANPEQRRAVELGVSGTSYCLIGSAGSGKTATEGLVTKEMLLNGAIRINSQLKSHKHLPNGCLNILICSYMNIPTNNIRNAVTQELKANVVTIHKALEYAPVLEEVERIDPETGKSFVKEVKVFRPQRNEDNKLVGIDIVIIEEATTCSDLLYQELMDAIEGGESAIQVILLGDLKQLPPVFGQSVLATKLLEFPVVELTKIYRTANDSPIKKFAIDINEGKPISDEEMVTRYKTPGEFDIFRLSGKRPDGTILPRQSAQRVVGQLAQYFNKALDAGEFVPFRDVILCPFRENPPATRPDGRDNPGHDGVNCDMLNKLIANHAGMMRDAEVHEIQAGITKKYLAVGDPVYFEKYQYTVIAIEKNPNYSGVPVKLASTTMTRDGYYRDASVQDMSFDLQIEETIAMAVIKDFDQESDPKAKAASHILTLELNVTDGSEPKTLKVSQSGQISGIEFAYALSVHKSIGSEWTKVWLVFHHTHLSMMFRELLYTAVTRAKSYLGIFYDGQDYKDLRKLNTSMIQVAITSPRIKGVTLEEKLKWLKAQKSLAADKTELLAKFKLGKATDSTDSTDSTEQPDQLDSLTGEQD